MGAFRFDLVIAAVTDDLAVLWKIFVLFLAEGRRHQFRLQQGAAAENIQDVIFHAVPADGEFGVWETRGWINR